MTQNYSHTKKEYIEMYHKLEEAANKFNDLLLEMRLLISMMENREVDIEVLKKSLQELQECKKILSQ